MARAGPGQAVTPDVESMRYTHGHHESVLRSHVWRTAENSCRYLLPELRPDDRILDVGCGPGTITLDLARHVPQGQVLGVDRSTKVLQQACSEARARGTNNVTFKEADAYALAGLDDEGLGGTPTVVHAHQVLQHLSRPVDALRHMASVVGDGGLLAVRDADYSAMSWYPELSELDRWREVYLAVAKHNGGEPDAGRRLLGWAQEAGMTSPTAHSSTWCFANPEDRGWWGGLWADRLTHSDVGRHAVGLGLSDHGELEWIAAGWRAWARAVDGWFTVVHGEVLARVSHRPKQGAEYGKTNI